ncbi:hypothetical protein [Pelagibius sp. Alg239-R121]|uniref:hypothetical protein n=1 Tax=Pelagibius sp. Alg239-R121 TaxID=2993448 RepID=UPI0024A76A1F|nr:hypothetical protein [Pelagibius sp. Alg239-R121]
MAAGLSCWRSSLVLVGLLVLGACTPEPIKTAPPLEIEDQIAPSLEGGRKPVVLSYCYSSQLNWSKQVLATAREACSGGKLHFQDEDVLWTKCPLFQPVRVTFLCYPPNSESSKQSLLR